MIRTLRLKFIAVTMAVVTVLLSVIFGLVIHFTGANLEEESIRFLRSAAEGPLQPGLPGQVQLPSFVIRVTPWGQRIQFSGGFDLSDDAMLTDIVTLAAAAEEDVGVLEDYSLRYLRTRSPGEATLVFTDISGERLTMRNLRLTCAAIGVLSVALFLAVSILLARWAVRPVEQAWAEQRQFVADASHELKTPLTVILTNAELLQTDPDPRYARSVLAMSRRMRTLVESLLELARVDGGAARASFEETDLSQLLEDELLPFEPVYFERGLTLRSDISGDIRISGSPRHLRQVVSILLDNAMNHSPEGSTVSLCLTRQGGSALLTAANPAPPMSREECQRIFRRFYRSDPARSGGGYGLGLPIAQGIVTDHGGRIWAESRDGELVFSVLLPLKKI